MMKLKHTCLCVLGSLLFASPLWGGAVNSTQAAQVQNNFAWTLFEKIHRAEQSQGNILFSPLSAWLALSLASNGAEGETWNEMRSLLGQSQWTREESNEAVHLLVDDLIHGFSTEETLRIANAIWTNDDLFELSQEFVQEAETWYQIRPEDAIARNESFADPQTLENINAWVSENTGGMIPSILDQLDPDMASLILNALFFEGQWLDPFVVPFTQHQDFHKADGTTMKVPMMQSPDHAMAFAQTGSFQILSLKFRGGTRESGMPLPGRFQLDLVLPTSDAFSLMDLNQDQYQELVRALQIQPVRVAIPKFKFSYKYVLNETLKASGMIKAFLPGASEFDRLGHVKGNGRIFISEVLQKTAVEMAEYGFKAAAVTAISVGTTSVPPKPERQFIADRPFFLALRDSRTGALLFQGVVGDPKFP